MDSPTDPDEAGAPRVEDLVYQMRRATRRVRARAWMLRIVAPRDRSDDGNDAEQR